MKPERPSRAPIKDASTPTTTHVPMTQVRAGSGGLSTAVSTQIPCDAQGIPLPRQLYRLFSPPLPAFDCGDGKVSPYVADFEDFPEH